MENKKNIKALKRIFEESESIEFSADELDQNLRNINIDPEKLVEEGLSRIGKLLEKQDKKVVPLNNSALNKFPIAAGKNKPELDVLKKKIDDGNGKNS